ncbi:MAG TPA: hypothetical protein VF478_06655 [Anaerolineae bacterium]
MLTDAFQAFLVAMSGSAGITVGAILLGTALIILYESAPKIASLSRRRNSNDWRSQRSSV